MATHFDYFELSDVEIDNTTVITLVKIADDLFKLRAHTQTFFNVCKFDPESYCTTFWPIDRLWLPANINSKAFSAIFTSELRMDPDDGIIKPFYRLTNEALSRNQVNNYLGVDPIDVSHSSVSLYCRWGEFKRIGYDNYPLAYKSSQSQASARAAWSLFPIQSGTQGCIKIGIGTIIIYLACIDSVSPFCFFLAVPLILNGGLNMNNRRILS